MSAPAIKVTYLLAVWGEQYIRQFMDLSLRSLLSPGNIPGLAGHTDSRFVFLTSRKDREAFTKHPAYALLERTCSIEFVTIDDLIFGGNYSATLTLAYERGMRHMGRDMLSTYFIYLVADYIMADGSLSNLLPYMQQGYSGITAGNFQAMEEDLQATIENLIDPQTGIMTIGARSLMALALPHLHPITIANTLTQDYSHTAHTNRLFWRADDNTLIGRFYLRHMLCIRPEIDNYIIGSSCDYSYIEEMCPSGKVAHISDSDEYCVIELQPFQHEQKFIKQGPLKTTTLIQSLGEWATAQQRSNIFTPVIFHAGDITPEAHAMVQRSLDYVTAIDRALPQPPKPARGHPYWLSCIEGVLELLLTKENQKDYCKHDTFAGVIGSPVFEPPLGNMHGDYNLLKTARYRFNTTWRERLRQAIHALGGGTTTPRIWHREYAHTRAIRRKLAQAAATSQRCIVIAFEPDPNAIWAQEQFPEHVVLQKSDLFAARSTENLQRIAHGADHAVILLPTAYLHKLGEILAKCSLCLEGGQRVTIVVTQRDFERGNVSFKSKLAVLAAYYHSASVRVDSFITLNVASRSLLDSEFRRYFEFVMGTRMNLKSILRRLWPAGMVCLISAGYLLLNPFVRTRRYPHTGKATCAIIQLRIVGKFYNLLSSRKQLEGQA